MVDNLVEKVDECPLNWGRYVLLMYNLDPENYGEERCPLFRSCLNIEVNGRTAGTSRIALYIVGVHCYGVPLYLCTLAVHIALFRGPCQLPVIAGLWRYFNKKNAGQTYLYCVPFASSMNRFGMTAASEC